MGLLGALRMDAWRAKNRVYDQSMMNQTQPTVRQINAHLMSGSNYCYVSGEGFGLRISRARTRKGITEGRVVNGERADGSKLNEWEPIPATATVELA